MEIGYQILLACLGACYVLLIWGIVTGRVVIRNPFIAESPMTPFDKPPEDNGWVSNTYKVTVDGKERPMTDEEKEEFKQEMSQFELDIIKMAEDITKMVERNK